MANIFAMSDAMIPLLNLISIRRGSMQYFIADTHFFHDNIILNCDRPFANVEEMNKTIIANWNATVNKNDEVYVLGDMFFRADDIKEINNTLKQLNGIKYLIYGNHDDYINHPDFDTSAFIFIKSYYTFKQNKRKFILFHYPILEWEGKKQGSILLYGHVHNDNPDYYANVLGKNAFNVGADMIDFRPISIQEIFKQIS
ncbi:metallophosphoesterase [Granulicatella sp.]